MKLLRLLQAWELQAKANSTTFASPKGSMHLFLQKESRLSRPLWLGLAVFFLVFCSSPVKKYIRMQLYKHHPVVERSAGQHLSTHDIKDCLIAERVDLAKILTPTLFINDEAPDMASDFFVTSLIALAILSLFTQYSLSRAVPRRRWRMATTMPRYLMVRHLRV